jgi:hypothetical protein
MWDSPIHLLIVLFVALVFCVPYFVPSIIALYKRKSNRGAILAMNILLGWTFVGWIVALVWALKVDVVDQRAP